jgi:predicted dehydrogenase
VLRRVSAGRADRPRLLLVGYGQRGRQWHTACRGRRDVELACAVDSDPAALEAARRDGLSAWPTLSDGLASARCDAAIVASPPHEHPDQTIACLRAGLAVLVEKPFALSLEAAGRVVQESATLGVPVMVGQNFRFLPRERAVRRALELDVGRPLGGSIVSTRSAAVAMPHLASIPHGPLWDIGVHHLDALRVRFGAAPEQVAMRITRLDEPSDARVRFDLALEWRDGPSFVYQHSEGAPGYHHSEWIECERRAIVVDDQDVSLRFPSHRPRPVRVSRGLDPEQAVIDELLESLRTGEAPTLHAEDNLLTVATLEAAVRSEALGRPVLLAEIAETAGVPLATGALVRG